MICHNDTPYVIGLPRQRFDLLHPSHGLTKYSVLSLQLGPVSSDTVWTLSYTKVFFSYQNMGDVLIEKPLNIQPPHKKHSPSNIPSIDIDGIGNDDSDEYSTLKKLQRHLEYRPEP